MEKEQQKNAIESLFERTKDYAETRIELGKLKAIRKVSEVVSSIASKIILGVILSFFITLLNIGIALWVGEILGKNYFGFFALAAFYIIIGFIVYATRNTIIKARVANSIIKKIDD